VYRSVKITRLADQKRIGPTLLPDRRRVAVPGVHLRVVAKREQDGTNRSHERVVITARQIGSADRAGEERVADEEVFSRRAFLANLQAHAAGTMSWRVVRPRLELSE
jgi:hypothetical protein